MSDPKAMNLDFGGLGEGSSPKLDKATTQRIATEAGQAEGFTSRTSASLFRRRRPVNIQMNLKVPEEFRERFQSAFMLEAEADRSIRTAGEFLVKLFEEWERERDRKQASR